MASELFVPPAIGPKGEFDNHVRRLEEAFSGIYRISQLEDSVQKLMQNFGLSVPQPEEPQTQSQPAREEVTKSPEISSSIGIAKEQISAMGLTQIEEESEPLFSPETKQISNDVVITSEKKDEIQPSPLVSSALDVTKTNEKSNLISLELKNTESKEFLSVETNQSFWVTTTTDGFVERFFRFKEVLSEEYLRPISVGLKGEELARYYLEEGWPPDPGWETFKQFPLAWFRSIQGCNHQEKLVIFTQISTEKEPRLQFAIFSTPTRRLPESNFAAMHEKGRLQADLKQIGFSGLRTWLKMAQIIKVKRIAMSTYKFGLNSLWPEHTPSGTHLSSKTTHLITFPNIPTTLSTTTLPLTSPATYPSISSLKPAEPKFEEKPILPKFISTITEPITKIAKIKIEEKSAKEKTENGGEKRRLEVEFKDEVKVHVKIDTETVEVKDPTPKLREYSDPKSGVGDGNADFVRQSTDVNQFHALEDTVVRWSAAKGVGRVTSRLTSALSEEVLSSVLELFRPGEGDGSWHGGCLALAELARRGLLLPTSLPKVVPVVVKALHYDVRRGHHSVGSHVRDAAAYVCWAFGRAYYHTDMRSVLEQLAAHLLSVACYDREVNCRRAAAAAFQENVGRQGNYPHGIDIVNTADYFSLSSRVNSYIHVAVCIVQYEGYLHPFVDELLHNKICHWDKGLRELAAEALAALVRYDTAYFAEFVLEKLIPFTLSSDLCTRHGATLSVGEVVLALHQCGYDLPSDKQKKISGIVPSIEKERLYRGKGGEIMRAAVSRFIECISFSQLPLPEKIKRSLIDTLNENLRHPNDQIQTAAVKALKHFAQAYLIATDNKNATGITLKYLLLLDDSNVAVRRGSAMALGVLPYELLASQWRDVILKLCSSCLIEDNPEDRDAEARVNAVKGLVSVCETLTQATENSDIHCGENDMSLFHLIKNEVMTSLFKALDDYSIDKRGDVGSWVREAAMEGLEKLTYILCKRDSISSTRKSDMLESVSKQPNSNVNEENQMGLFFDINLATNFVGGIAKQAVEKLDKLREVAAKVLQRILYHKEIFIPFIPYREKIEEIVPNETDLKWGVPTFSYPRFVQLLQFSCYSRPVLSGLVISIGGLQESLRKASLSAFLEYILVDEDIHKESTLCRLSTDFLWILQEYNRRNRVIIPTLKTIEILLSKRIFLDMEVHTLIFCAGVLDSLEVELKGSKFSKFYAGIAILGYICSISDPIINSRAFSNLLTFLSNQYPMIRKAAADQVYLVLLQNGSIVSEEKTDKALEIISETCWDGDLETAKLMMLELYEIAGLDVGQLKTSEKVAKKDDKKSAAADENESYSSLVDSSGF